MKLVRIDRALLAAVSAAAHASPRATTRLGVRAANSDTVAALQHDGPAGAQRNVKPSHWSYWAAAAVLSASAHAQVSVRDAWVRGTVAGQGTSGVFMRLESTQNTALVEARSPLAEAVELHSTVTENDVMRMRRVARIEVPALTPVQLRPGSFHVMLVGLKAPLAPGARVPITLVFEAGGKRSTVELNAEVRALGAGEPHSHKH